MKQSLSLVPVSTSNAVVEIDEDHAAVNAEKEERAQSEFETLTEEVDHLEFEMDIVNERASNTRRHMEGKFSDLVDEINSLTLDLEEKRMREWEAMRDSDIDLEDDDEDSDAAKDVDEKLKEQMNSSADDDERSDIDDEDNGSTHVDKEAQDERQNLMTSCRKLYLAIAKATHPDRCKNKNRVKFFRAAVEAYKNLNLMELEEIYAKVFGKPSSKQSLFDRILSLRMRKAELEAEIARIKSTISWQLHILEVREGRDYAEKQFEAGLRHKIRQLKSLLSGDFSQCES